jgi:hypothetical protein
MVGLVLGVLVLWGVWLTLPDWRAKLRNVPWWFGIVLATAVGIALVASGYHNLVSSGHH